MNLPFLKKIVKILYEEDPVGLKPPHEDEYQNEAMMFLRKLHSKNYDDVLEILYGVFVSQFNYGEDLDGNATYFDVVGDKSNFESSTKRICALLNEDK